MANPRSHRPSHPRSLLRRPRTRLAILQLQAAHGAQSEAQSRTLRPRRAGQKERGLPHPLPKRRRYLHPHLSPHNARTLTPLRATGLSPRANHPEASLKLLHGSLFDVKCSDFFCNYLEKNNYTDPIVPALALPTSGEDPTTTSALAARELDISDESVPIPELSYKHLPQCPKCKRGLLRPGVVWFGEALPSRVLRDIDEWLKESEKIDLIMVVGTSAKVYPAAGYVDLARAKGARVAIINMDPNDVTAGGLGKGDWFFQGDAAQILPEILKSVIGEVDGGRDAAAAKG